jgi:hypothetical protein
MEGMIPTNILMKFSGKTGTVFPTSYQTQWQRRVCNIPDAKCDKSVYYREEKRFQHTLGTRPSYIISKAFQIGSFLRESFHSNTNPKNLPSIQFTLLYFTLLYFTLPLNWRFAIILMLITEAFRKTPNYSWSL